MISLTFVRNSNGYHGRVVKTTRFRSARYGFESQPSTIFLIWLVRRKIVIPPLLMYEKIRYQNFSETTKGSATKFFGTVRQKIFDGKKIVILHASSPPPPRYKKFFDTKNFLKYRRVLRSFSVLWDKNFPTEDRCIPFLCIKFVDIRNFLKHWKVPQEIFRHRETKNFRRKNVIPPSVLSIPNKFYSIPELFWNPEKLIKIFVAVRKLCRC